MRLSCLNAILFTLLICLILPHCRQQEDPRIQQLQKDVSRLTEENERLTVQLKSLQEELVRQQSLQTALSAPETPKEPEMTVDRMKLELSPLLMDVIKKMKAAAETPKKGTQFGMRVEYDLKKAIYGLVRNEDPAVPYWAKVIVSYEKFLESETLSRSYGSGSVQFLFAYANHRWVLLNYQ